MMFNFFQPEALHDLVKGVRRGNLFVIGFGVPRFLNNNTIGYFREDIYSNIFVEKDGAEMMDIISFWRMKSMKMQKYLFKMFVNICVSIMVAIYF